MQRVAAQSVIGTKIVGTETKDEGGRKFTVFKVEVRSEGGSWQLLRRWEYCRFCLTNLIYLQTDTDSFTSWTPNFESTSLHFQVSCFIFH